MVLGKLLHVYMGLVSRTLLKERAEDASVLKVVVT